MKEYDLQNLINNSTIIEKKIEELMQKKLLFKQNIDVDEIRGHLLKAEHNLRFVADIAQKDYFDWSLTGCYYACYHAALRLIQSKGDNSKNHLATLCIIIKEFYNKELTKEDIELLSNFLDYEDILFSVEAKQKRKAATYSTKTIFDKKDIEMTRIQAVMFVNKIKDIINEQRF